MQAFFLIVLILLLFDNGKANVFKRIDSDCQPSGVHCLSSNTFTYCLNRGGVSALLYFEFNCPRNYICDDSAKSACVRRPIQSALLNNDIKTTTESILIDRILNGLITNSLQEQVYNIMGRVPSVEIEAEDVNVHNIGSNSVIITPTTTTITTPILSDKFPNRITPINFLTSASVMFADDSGEDPDSTIITSDGVNTGSGSSVIITPDSPSSSEEGSSVIITPSDPNPPGSVIITPDTTVSPGSVIITPEDDDSVIITPTTTTPGSIIIVPKIESAIGVSQSSSKDAPTVITTTSVQDSGEDPDSTIITSDGVNTDSGDSVIITPDSPSSSEEGSSVIITPSDPNPSGSVIITPDTTVSPGSVIITPEDDDSVIITPTTTTPGSIIIVPKIESAIGVSQSSSKDAPTAITTTSVHSNKPSNKITPINFLSSASAMFVEDSGEDPDSTIITSDGVNTGSGSSVIITPDSPSSSEEGSSVIITPSDPSPPGSVIITPDTTVSPGSVIITPEDDDSVIITPTTTTPGSIIIVPKIEAASGASATKITSAVGNNLLNKIIPINSASGSTVFAADSSEQADSTIITSNSSSNSDGSATAKTQPSSGPVNISPGSDPVGPVIVEPKVGEEPLIKQSVIITPSTTATPSGVIITPSSSTTTSGSVIIVPTTTPPVTGDTPPDCTGVGYYWGPTCTQYYSCIAVWWWYEYRLETCSSGLWFSLANGACVNPADSECV